MEYERKTITITWQIENVICFRRLFSPVISVDALDGTKWKLGVIQMPHPIDPCSPITLTIKREAEDDGPEEYGLHYLFSVNAFRSISSTPKIPYSYSFRQNQECPNFELRGGKIIYTLGPIIIHCKLWKLKGSIPKSDHFFVRTRMRSEHLTFVGLVKNFSGLSEGDRKILKIVTSSTGEKLMALNLVLYHTDPIMTGIKEDQLQIEINPIGNQGDRHFIFKFFILDSSGGKTDFCLYQNNITLPAPKRISISGTSMQYLTKNASRYLQNDSLSLHCEIKFCFEVDYEKVERTEYEKNCVAEVKQTYFSEAVEFEMSKMDILCDMQLQTATERFPANTAILSAESPVFEAMFKTNMTESTQKCVHIDDLEAETVKHMLLFLYSDTLEELEWKDAVKLYFAADKYQILPLTKKCTELLKQSLDLSNCCVLLLQADMHQDEDLKIAVQNYMVKCGRKALQCDEWEDLEKNHPQLANIFSPNDNYKVGSAIQRR